MALSCCCDRTCPASRPTRHARFLSAGATGLVSLFLAGCAGEQSALAPAGRGAAQILNLFHWMAGGAAVIWLAVVVLAIYADRSSAGQHSRRTALFIIGGGVAVPTLVLFVLLVYGLSMLPNLVAPAPEGSQRIHVTGEQFWWRVRYETPSGKAVELANEIHLPVGESVEFELESADVVHAFWIPSLGGKIDMVPGRTNRLHLEPTRTGVFRGVCAEYCGSSHAFMAFTVVVEEREDFDAWLEHQANVAVAPTNDRALRGQTIFASSGCGACHAIRGTEAKGVIGPDLTHVGSRRKIGAAALANDRDGLLRWIAHTDSVKPGVQMPEFYMLPPDDQRELAEYLIGLD